MGLVAYFTKEEHDEFKSKIGSTISLDPYDVGFLGRQEFFLYTTGVGVVFAVLGLVCVIAGLLQKKHGALAVSIKANNLVNRQIQRSGMAEKK
jgi:hypothetical protein